MELCRCCRYVTFILILSLSFVCSAFSADSVKNEIRACQKEARTTKNACTAVCQVDFQIANGLCTDRDPLCVKSCRVDYRACAAPLDDSLRTCRAGCEAPLKNAREQCRTQCSCKGGKCTKDSCYRSCQSPALLNHFSCVQTCRDNWVLNTEYQDALKACADTRRECLKSCKTQVAQ